MQRSTGGDTMHRRRPLLGKTRGRRSRCILGVTFTWFARTEKRLSRRLSASPLMGATSLKHDGKALLRRCNCRQPCRAAMNIILTASFRISVRDLPAECDASIFYWYRSAGPWWQARRCSNRARCGLLL